MISTAKAIPEITCKVLGVDLMPRFTDWREHDVSDPALGYKVRLRVIDGAEVYQGTLWVPTQRKGNQIQSIGIESATAPIPKYDRGAAMPQVEASGKVKMDENGFPLLATIESKLTSHWAVARFIPTRGGAALKLTGVVISPKKIPDGPAKGALAVTAQGIQSVNISCDGWEPTILETQMATGEFRDVASATSAQVPQWATAEKA